MVDGILLNISETEQGSSSLPSLSSKRPQHDRTRNEKNHHTSHPPRFLLRGNNANRQSLGQSHQVEEPILISHSCLLIPVFLAAWWYYTKKLFRKVTGFIRHKPEPEERESEKFHDKFFRFDDAYIRWEDILDDTKDGTRTDRFVKWINRRNLRRRQARNDVRSTTHRVLNSSPSEGNSSRRDRRISTLDSYEGYCVLDPLTQPPPMQWECLSDAGDMELCAMGSTVVEGEDSVVTLGSLRRMLSDEDLMEARTMPTLAESLSHMTGASEDEMATPYDEAAVRDFS